MLVLGCPSTDDGAAAGSSETGSGDTTPTDDGTGAEAPPTLEEVCGLDCGARQAACALPVPGCLEDCNSLVALGEFCGPEWAALVQCHSAAGYECVDGVAAPLPGCDDPQFGFDLCTADLPCKRFCSAATACSGETFEACVAACTLDEGALPEPCQPLERAYRMCIGAQPTQCSEDALLVPAECEAEARQTGKCIIDETADVCTGYCTAAEPSGCADDCPSECAARLDDAECGPTFETLVACALNTDGLLCTEMGWVGGQSICQRLSAQYQACLG
ncbi:MAG: hypothetical protein AAF721_21470 [Myxococcota bacterium]